MDFYGTVAAGDAEAVERICARIVADLAIQLPAADFAIQWGNRFFAAVDACRERGFRRLHDCECDSLVDTCAAFDRSVEPATYVDELFHYMCAPPLHSEAEEAITRIDLPICCVSNADTDHLQAAIVHHDLAFAEVMSSEGARAYKPGVEIFERAMEAMSLRPDQVLHVGDSLHSDVAGGRAAGIDTAWICRDRRVHDVGNGQPTYKILSLNELHAILG